MPGGRGVLVPLELLCSLLEKTELFPLDPPRREVMVDREILNREERKPRWRSAEKALAALAALPSDCRPAERVGADDAR